MMNALSVLFFALVFCIGGSAHAGSPARGKQIFDHWCSACHAPGSRMPGTAALSAKYGKDLPAALEERKDLAPDTIKYFVRHGVSIMPPFRKTEITDAELDALADYLAQHNEGSGK